MEIRHLHTFLQVASIQNFTQAARNLGYSQSNISAQIKQLEQEVGAPLFNRIGRGVTLTQYGEELLPYARQIVSTSMKMENFLKTEAALGGTIRIGIVESLFQPLIENAVLRYHALCPQVKVEVTVDGTATLEEQLRRGTLDAACLIDNMLPHTEWTIWHIESIPIVVVANPKNALVESETLQLGDLKDEEFIMMEETAFYSSQFRHAMLMYNPRFAPVLTMQSADKARDLGARGNFLSVLPY